MRKSLLKYLAAVVLFTVPALARDLAQYTDEEMDLYRHLFMQLGAPEVAAGVSMRYENGLAQMLGLNESERKALSNLAAKSRILTRAMAAEQQTILKNQSPRATDAVNPILSRRDSAVSEWARELLSVLRPGPMQRLREMISRR